MKRSLAAFAVVAAGSAAWAQGPGGWVIEVNYGPGQTSVNPDNPTCRVRISATHHPGDYAVAWVRFDALSDEAGWAEPRFADNLVPMNTGSNPGANVGPNRVGIAGGQINFPSVNIFADPRSPIGVWEAVWSTDRFNTRWVQVSTATGRFDVYSTRNSFDGTSRLPGLAEGRAAIAVTPAPSALVCALLGGTLARPRRRGRDTGGGQP